MYHLSTEEHGTVKSHDDSLTIAALLSRYLHINHESSMSDLQHSSPDPRLPHIGARELMKKFRFRFRFRFQFKWM
jgi:hypothetical protein